MKNKCQTNVTFQFQLYLNVVVCCELIRLFSFLFHWVNPFFSNTRKKLLLQKQNIHQTIKQTHISEWRFSRCLPVSRQVFLIHLLNWCHSGGWSTQSIEIDSIYNCFFILFVIRLNSISSNEFHLNNIFSFNRNYKTSTLYDLGFILRVAMEALFFFLTFKKSRKKMKMNLNYSLRKKLIVLFWLKAECSKLKLSFSNDSLS